MEPNIEKNTPLMQQYFDIKSQYPDTLLFFQVGDFYELFFKDAQIASAYLAIALTKRGKNKGEDVPLCGVPVHALNHYVTKLIKGGFCVAICDQTSKPQPGTMVQRSVSRVLTPATLTETAMLDDKSASYLLSFFPTQQSVGLLFGELMTAQLFATAIPINDTRLIENELIRFFPDEIVMPRTIASSAWPTYFKRLGYYTSFIDQPQATDIAGPDIPVAWLTAFEQKTQQQLTQLPAVGHSLATMYRYLERSNTKALEQFKTVTFYQPDDYLILDAATQKNLELINNSQDGGRKNTLLAVLDHAKTAMGSRTIKKWVQRPLVQPAAILQRQEVVAALRNNVTLLHQMEQQLAQVADIERIIGRIALRRATVHDYRALLDSLRLVPTIKLYLSQLNTLSLAQTLTTAIGDFTPLEQLLSSSIADDPATGITIKQGFDHQLDRLRYVLANGQQEILKLEQLEVAQTGISSLKIGYNQISGYYLEVTNTHTEKIPDRYTHQQTLANRKRFTTPELKALENDLFKAQNELEAIETEVFERIKIEVDSYRSQLRQLAQSLASVDALFGFAFAAYEYQYVTPQFNDNRVIHINSGRHPVVEQALGDAFIPNHTELHDAQSTWIITGPNMGGKSTYLRQVALICVMAQCGSLVPAAAAQLPIIDRIFTRIGSGDNVAEGKSTFLVEMEETATICTQATANSLVILDEVGRGTSTYDGIALAQAIVEYLHQKIGARCLFATHYHELTSLADRFTGIINVHTACKKVNDTIVFLHTVKPGVAGGSFGLEVAKLAQLPQPIINRATTILNQLVTAAGDAGRQRSLFAAITNAEPSTTACNHEATIATLEAKIATYEHHLQILHAIKPEDLTPKQAFEVVWRFKETLEK